MSEVSSSKSAMVSTDDQKISYGSFVVTAILKRDIFSETRLGYFENAPERRVVRRVVSASPWWSRPLAWILARREI